jgi:hypothetical protein
MEMNGQLHSLAALSPGKALPCVSCRRLGGPQSRSGRYGENKNLSPAGNRIPAAQPVARRYTDWAIPYPVIITVINIVTDRHIIIFLFENWGGGVHTGSTRHCGHSWPIVSAPGDCNDGEFGGMNDFGRGSRSTRRKHAPTPLYSPQIPLARSA